MTFFVRPATPDDALAIETVRIQTWKFAYRDAMPDAFLDGLAVTDENVRLRTRALGSGRTRAFVAVSAGTEKDAPEGTDEVAPGGAGADAVVGFSMFGESRDDRADTEVYAIYVLPGHLSTGLGRALMATTVEAIPAERTIGLWVLSANPRARRFYERFGFVESGFSKVEDGMEEIHYRLAARSE
ncbi:GNAT family N-acetyltransferase [Nonomuraea mangrovi]|uniref:GNAT family N-acetyltransferase n=1 Tax=Nonomuraea mangrovi TaxID=2316207 RepID=A0ABW4SYU8_9ACTN